MDYNQTKIIKMLNLSTQLDNTNLPQPITKQCLLMVSLWCQKKVALVIKEKTQAKHGQVKVSGYFLVDHKFYW